MCLWPARISAVARLGSMPRGRSGTMASNASSPQCIISTSFADIFYNNCFKNGVLPLVLPPEQVREIMDKAESDPGIELNVDLVSQRVWDESEEISISFDIDAARKDALVNGLDDIGLTLRMEKDIGDYESKHGFKAIS